MPDLLVPLYKLPPRTDAEAAITGRGILLRRPGTYEISPVLDFIRVNFKQAWADETSVCFSRQPVSCFVATENQKVVGFAAFEATRKAFFGPTGVATSHRGRGIGKALLIASMWGLADLGYAYAIIGGAGPMDFYSKIVKVIAIPDSVPGIYVDVLKTGPGAGDSMRTK